MYLSVDPIIILSSDELLVICSFINLENIPGVLSRHIPQYAVNLINLSANGIKLETTGNGQRLKSPSNPAAITIFFLISTHSFIKSTASLKNCISSIIITL